jgi:CheY-like chemotaxis protein
VRPPAGDNRIVLVVEDELRVRTTAVRALQEAGYGVLEAADGQEALDVLDRAPKVELVITDVGMPVMDGNELARRLEQLRPDLPILLISGYGDSGTSRPYLQKPFSPDQLIHRVGELLADSARAARGRSER